VLRMKVVKSPNYNDRSGGGVKYLIMHYTGMETGQAALQRLCDAEASVSAHYLIDLNGDVYSLVPEEKRAWHAGISQWEDDIDINDLSIGIELVNTGHSYPGYESEYKAFPQEQMNSLIKISKKIIERHQIKPWHVLGHSDIAWKRKIDPGELFDWKGLAREGIGSFIENPKKEVSFSMNVNSFLRKLNSYGYDTQCSNDDSHEIMTAFQRHFRPQNICGELDEETIYILEKLLEDKLS
jgi:N-acetylmuramoyl-L-alanine amidase